MTEVVDLFQAELAARAEIGDAGELLTDDSYREMRVEKGVAAALAAGPANAVLAIILRIRTEELSRRTPTKRLRPER